jgi:large subunit ribosomal protein L17
LITLAKQGTVHARRIAFQRLRQKSAVKTLFDEVAPRFKDRNGGYTRMVKLGRRSGDGAPVAVVELVGFETAVKKQKDRQARVEAKKEKEKKKAKASEKAEKAEEVAKEKKADKKKEDKKAEEKPKSKEKDKKADGDKEKKPGKKRRVPSSGRYPSFIPFYGTAGPGTQRSPQSGTGPGRSEEIVLLVVALEEHVFPVREFLDGTLAAEEEEIAHR